jgi:hypothetical protein
LKGNPKDPKGFPGSPGYLNSPDILPEKAPIDEETFRVWLSCPTLQRNQPGRSLFISQREEKIQ